MGSIIHALTSTAGPGFLATTTTSLAIGTGSKTFTTQTGLAYLAGDRVRLTYTGDLTKYFEGQITSYTSNSGSMTVNFTYVPTGVSGTFASWNIGIGGDKGDQGIQGPTGASYPTTSLTSNSIGLGAKSFTVGSGLAYQPNDWILITKDAVNYMIGTVTTYSGTSLVANITIISGSGTYATWTIDLSGSPGAGFFCTSTTSLTIASGTQTFTVQANLAYTAGAIVIAASAANSANFMIGTVTSYSGTTLVINVTGVGGSGTHADWNINPSGPQGPTGPSGGLSDPGSNSVVFRLSLNTTRAAVGNDLPVFGGVGVSHSAGAVPDPGASGSASRVLRADGTWGAAMVGMAPQPDVTQTVDPANGAVTYTLLDSAGDGTHTGGQLISMGIDIGQNLIGWTSVAIQITVDGQAMQSFNAYGTTGASVDAEWKARSILVNGGSTYLRYFNLLFASHLKVQAVVTGGNNTTLSPHAVIRMNYAYATS